MDQNDQAIEDLKKIERGERSPAPPGVERQRAAPPPDVSGAYEARARSIEAAGERKGQIEGQIAGQAAAQQRDIQQQFEPQFKKTPEFQAPKEEGAQIAGAVAMLGAIAAFAGGKSYGNALMAMNAMSGMLNGYREGRKEVFDKAKIEYEKNVQAIKAHNDQITAAYNRALKAAPANLTAATSQLRQELSALDAKMQAEAVRTQGIEKAASTWNQARQNEVQLERLRAITQRQQNQVNQAAGRTVPVVDPNDPTKTILVSQAQAAAAAQEGRPYAPAPKTTAAGQNAMTFASRVYGNIEGAAQDLVSIANSPDVAQSPVFSGIINQDPNTIYGSLVALAARKITDEEARAFDQLSQQVGLALSRLEAQGLANGSTAAQVRGFDALRPKAGDAAINMALYLAKVRQEIETGVRVHSAMNGANAEQKRNAQDRLAEIREAVPFQIKDVLDVVRNNRGTLSEAMQQLLRQPGIVQSGVEGASQGAGAARAPAPTRQFSAEERQALDWANANPNDPRASQIKQRLGVQ